MYNIYRHNDSEWNAVYIIHNAETIDTAGDDAFEHEGELWELIKHEKLEHAQAAARHLADNNRDQIFRVWDADAQLFIPGIFFKEILELKPA